MNLPIRVRVATVFEELQDVLPADRGLGGPRHVDHHELVGSLLGGVRRCHLDSLVADDEVGELPLVRGDPEAADPFGDVVRRSQEGAEQGAVVRRGQAGGLPSFLDGVKLLDIYGWQNPRISEH